MSLLDDYDYKRISKPTTNDGKLAYEKCMEVVYPTIEEKAANFLYLITKNHAFIEMVNKLLIIIH